MVAFACDSVDLVYQKFDDQTKKGAHEEYLKSIVFYQVNGENKIPEEFLIAKGQKE